MNYKFFTYFFIIFASIIMSLILNNNTVSNIDDKSIDLVNSNFKKENFITIGNLTVDVPDGWIQETPQSSMRLTQFKLPSKDSEYNDAELSVFNAIGGTTQDNLDRWYKQFDQIDGIPSKQKARVRDFSIQSDLTKVLNLNFLKKKINYFNQNFYNGFVAIWAPGI